jgi:hypothetical protein
VRNFAKVAIARIGFLNRLERDAQQREFPVQLTPWGTLSCLYGFLMNRSGLSLFVEVSLCGWEGRKRSGPRALQIRNMALLVLGIVSGLACLFLIFVLAQWTRDNQRRPIQNSEASAKNQTEVAQSQGLIAFPRKATSEEPTEPNHSNGGPSRQSQRGAVCGPCERLAYEKLVRFSIRERKR